MEELLMECTTDASLVKKAVSNLSVLNEAYDYARPSSFSRGLRLDLGNFSILLIALFARLASVVHSTRSSSILMCNPPKL
jgi:hypothetical protein